MATDDFFRSRLDQMVDLRHPLVVLGTRMPWEGLEASLAPLLARRDRLGRVVAEADLFGPNTEVVGAGVTGVRHQNAFSDVSRSLGSIESMG